MESVPQLPAMQNNKYQIVNTLNEFHKLHECYYCLTLTTALEKKYKPY